MIEFDVFTHTYPLCIGYNIIVIACTYNSFAYFCALELIVTYKYNKN